VVEGASRIQVTLTDRRIFDARVIGRDPTTDVALVKIEARGLPTVPLGDDRQVQVGQPVIAIGNPLGLRSTVTTASSRPRSAAPTSTGCSARRTRWPTSSRPTRSSTPATRAGRSWTWPGA
jgi:S1-C subfamily serine protease